jgi:soluble lytic murein transglycosylase
VKRLAPPSLVSLALLTSLGGLAACRGSNAPSVAASKSAEPKPAPRPSVPVLHALLDDPRLARAKELDGAKDWAGAAKALADARPQDLPSSERCAWDFVEGRFLALANTPVEAAAAFGRAADGACPLASWAHLRAAQALGRAGHADEAIAQAHAVPDALGAARDEVKLVLAESLAAKGDRAAALPLWRAWLAANPHGSRWVDTSVRIATAILDGVDGPPDDHAREAYDLATKVVVEAPKLADSAGAISVRSRAVGVLHAHDATVTEALPDDARARQAQAWLDLGEPQKAFELTSALLASAKTGPAACRAAITRANAAAKAKGNKTDGWPDAVAACEKDDQLVTALYAGAKAHASKDPKLAIDWFAKVEERFPSNRLADDARYRGALLVQATEDERGEQMLRTLPDAYPSGDMKTEALFRVALDKMKRGDWEAAKPLLDRIVELTPDDRHWATAGRAEYFRARAAAATGDADGAKSRLLAIVGKYPLSFYMLLAHARLAVDDAPAAAKALKDAAARDGGGTFPSHPLPILETPGVVRAMRLLEVGENDTAKRELSAAGALADGVDPDVIWTIGAWYNEVGAPDVGHSFSRGRLTDFLAHYPEGRWRVPWETAYPRAFQSLVVKSCGDNALPTTLAWAIMREESSFVADVRSRSNAIGLMQLIVPTAKWVASGTGLPSDETGLKRPEVSIELGVRLLAKLRAKHGNLALAIGAYNSGSGAVDRWVAAPLSEDLDLFVELVPYDETRNYVKRVLSSQAAYAYLYDPTALKEPLGLPLRLAR